MTSYPELVLPFAALGRDSLPVAGGKGANLGALTQAGAAVPPGFVVTTAAYRLSIEKAGLADRMRGPQDGPSLARLRRAVTALEPPPELMEEVLVSYRRLGGEPVAVRSSGTAEDLPGAAFAGQHDTFLNVIGEQQLLDGIRQCWASLWTDRAVDYRSRVGMGEAEVAMAVIIQQMVDSDIAGVMFSVDPVSGDPDRLVIEASPGLGEAVVSGQVTPDHYLVTKRSGRRREISLGRAEVVIRSAKGGGTTETEGSVSTKPVLGDQHVRELTRIGRQIEDHFGSPQDIEWALADGGFFILQARPMTAVPEPLAIDPRQRISAAMLAELLPVRPTPMDLSTWTQEVYRGLRTFTGSVGVDPSPFTKVIQLENGVAVSLTPPIMRMGPRTPIRMIRSWIQGDRYTSQALLDDPRMQNFFTGVREGLERDLERLPYADLMPALQDALGLVQAVMRVRARFLARSALSTVAFMITLTLLGRRQEFGTLAAGVETKTAETNRALVDLARLVRSDRALMRQFQEATPDRLGAALERTSEGRTFLTSFHRFLADYGHREALLLYVSKPVWRDAPGTVFALLKGMINAPDEPAEQVGVVRAERRLFRHPALRIRFIRDVVVRQLGRARDFTRFREDTHFYAAMAQPVVRRILIEYGRRLTAAGVLKDAEEIFWLRRNDLDLRWPPTTADIARMQYLINDRLMITERLAGKVLIDPRFLASKAGVENALLTGISGSSGTVTGPVRIIRSESEFDLLRDGEILVAPYTNPSWTPLFQRAGAVVVDTGGPGSHAAIVAREYGKPAVLGTINAVDTLEDGMIITVDGDRGAVLPVTS